MAAHFTATRPPAVAGAFYTRSPERLRREVQGYIEPPVHTEAGRRLRALIVPHAGYTYSGATAGRAYAYVAAAPGFSRAAVLAPSHRCGFHGLSVGDYGSFATPLGAMAVDTAACGRLARKHALISTRTDAHTSEHALEVQLPFLQTVLPEAVLIPIVCGHVSANDISDLAATLGEEVWDPDTLWVISSDFTHFGSSFGYVPFQNDVQARLSELDHGAIDRILRFDPAGFLDYVHDTGATICGAMPIALLLAVLQQSGEEVQAREVHYTTSGKLTSDDRHSVSYASILFSVPDAGDDRQARAPLTRAEQGILLQAARAEIAAELGLPDVDAPEEITPALQEPGACFVTLHSDGRLRGCIGTLEAREPLLDNVRRNARSAAFGDPRFSPLSREEFAGIDIEISVLTAPRPIPGPEAFEVGRHGVILEHGRHRAVFLPQVAPEQGWDRETTLAHLSLKAGMDANGWRRSGTRFSVFEAFVFGDRAD